MKVTNFLTRMLLIVMVIVPFAISCSSSDDTPSQTSISLTASTSTVVEGQSVSFTVMDNLNSNVTSNATFSINGSSISNPYVFSTAGTYDVIAKLNSLTSNTFTVTVTVPQPTSLTLAASEDTVATNGSVTFTVSDDLGNDVTSSSEIKVNNAVIASNPYTFTTAGSYTVQATYQSLTSNQLTVTVQAPSPFSDTESFSASGAPATFTKKALLEDFTGTWCPNCPPAAAAIANARSGNSNILGVGYHDNDPMQTSETSFWQNYYNVTGFPTVYVNGADTRWNFPNMAQVDNELAEDAAVGLAVTANLIGGKLDLEVKVGYKSAISEEIKLMIYLVEDDVTSSSAQAGSSQGVNYVHKDVMRKTYTNRLGDVIATSNIGVGGVYTRTITGLDLPNTIDDNDKLKVIVFVRNTYVKTFTDFFGTVHTDSPHYDIYNVQEVEVGGSQDFD